MRHLGSNMQGAFAEQFVARADRAVRIPPDMDFAVAALLEPVLRVPGGAWPSKVDPGRDLLIVGDGPFGTLMALIAHRQGDKGVVLAGHHDFRLSFAEP